jgi:hypothetical protein
MSPDHATFHGQPEKQSKFATSSSGFGRSPTTVNFA